MSDNEKKAVWISTYLVAMYRMLPIPDEVFVERSIIPGNAEFLANKAVAAFENAFNNKVEGR